jgi:glycerol-3-phosphate acyltransferase PlsY
MLLKAVLVIAAYLMGTIPFGYILVKHLFTGGDDIRRMGSGGTGATNVTRRAGRLAGLLTLFLDAAKGAAAVWLMQAVAGDDYRAMGAAGVAAVAGHVFSVFLRFRGGKGVATGVGVFLALAPYAVLAALVVFVFVVYSTRYVSLGSITASLSLPFFALLIYGWLWPSSAQWAHLSEIIVTSIVIGGLIIVMHKENIRRLLSGTESKFGSRVSGADPDAPIASGGRS